MDMHPCHHPSKANIPRRVPIRPLGRSRSSYIMRWSFAPLDLWEVMSTWGPLLKTPFDMSSNLICNIREHLRAFVLFFFLLAFYTFPVEWSNLSEPTPLLAHNLVPILSIYAHAGSCCIPISYRPPSFALTLLYLFLIFNLAVYT